MKVPLPSIIIKDRQRLDLGDIDSLADSLRQHGQIHTILLNEKNELICGRRRVEAARLLGWTELEATVRVGATPLDEQLLEFEEDYARKDRSWQEGCLAIRKVNRFYETAKKRGEIDAWSSRALSKVTGLSNMSLNYMLRVAEALATDPPDKEVWEATGWTTAIQVLLKRQCAEIEKEMETRRPPAVTVADVTPPPSEGGVHPVDTTEPETKIVIQGYQFPYWDERAIPHRAEVSSCVLAFGLPTSCIRILYKELRSGGFAVLWGTDPPEFHTELVGMPYPLVWHLIHTPDGWQWPFVNNVILGLVLRKGDPTLHFSPPSSSVISAAAADDPTVLPPAIVDFSVSKIATERMAVILPCGVDPVTVAELGRFPIWYEPDAAKFQAKYEALKRHYEALIPNCKVSLCDQ